MDNYNFDPCCNPCNNCCNNPCCDPCNNCCTPASYACNFSIQANPNDPSEWLFDFNGHLNHVKIPKIAETCTTLTSDFSTASLRFNGECSEQVITGTQLGELINLDDLRDVEAENADSCDLMVFDPGCTECGPGCKPKPARWRSYHIPDAGDCELTAKDGFYHILVKDDCGCIKECKLPIATDGATIINYVRDSVPDDPDFPWYYGCYNDRINLHLAENAPKWFGKYDLEVTINYGIQVIKSGQCQNVNFRSLLCPVVGDNEPNVSMMSSILQDDSTTRGNDGKPYIPWGTKSMRGSFTFVAPKGKEAYLHHEFRLRSKDSGKNYYTNPTYDGVRVPDDIAAQVDKIPHNASRLNALQVLVKPIKGGVVNLTPVTDPDRGQLDPAVDKYPAL